MKKLILMIVLPLLMSCSTFSTTKQWSIADKVLYGGIVAMDIADVQLTKTLLKHEGYCEVNPFYVNTTSMLAMKGVNLYLLPIAIDKSEHRTELLVVELLLKTIVAVNNYNVKRRK